MLDWMLLANFGAFQEKQMKNHRKNMYNERIEALISAALADGVLTEKEKQILLKNAKSEGIDLDEFEMVLNARLFNTQERTSDTRNNKKYGDVRTCPACGAIVPAFAGKCQECGYEFVNVNGNTSCKRLATQLLQTSSDEVKIELIENHSISNTKADILDFLLFAKPKLLGSYDKFSDAYLKKYQECIEKAEILFGEDAQIQGFIKGFPNIKKKVERKKTIKSTVSIIKTTLIIIAVLVAILLFIFACNWAYNNFWSCILIFLGISILVGVAKFVLGVIFDV